MKTEQKREFGCIWWTGKMFLKQDKKGDWHFQELSTDPADARLNYMNSGVCPLTFGHNGQQIGIVVRNSAFVNNGGGYADIRFSNDSFAEKVLRLVINGSARAVSIGAKNVDWIDVPGKNGGLPKVFFTTWEPYEISIVAKGSDSGARVLI